MIKINDDYYVAYVNVYSASSGFTGNPHGTDEEWQKGDEIPELDCQIRAIIKRIKEGNRSRFILIDYLKQE